MSYHIIVNNIWYQPREQFHWKAWIYYIKKKRNTLVIFSTVRTLTVYYYYKCNKYLLLIEYLCIWIENILKCVVNTNTISWKLKKNLGICFLLLSCTLRNPQNNPFCQIQLLKILKNLKEFLCLIGAVNAIDDFIAPIPN